MTEPGAGTGEDRVVLSFEIEGLRLRFEGSRAFYEETLRDALVPVATGRWRAPVPPPPSPTAVVARAVAAEAAAPTVFVAEEEDAAEQEGPAPHPSSPSRPTPSIFRPPAFPPSSPAPASSPPPPAPPPAPAPRPAPRAAESAALDATALYARLAKDEARRSERDAVLLALVALAIAGKKDATPAEVLAHMEAHGFPSRDVKAKPVLAKLCHRKGMAAPGLLPNTFRVTPAGAAHIFRRSKETYGV